LRARSAEIEDTVYNRVRQMADPVEREDPEYRAYLRATVAEAIDYALLGIERGEDWNGAIPEAAMVQARRAARTGVKLDAVLRRYAAGDRLVGEFVVDEAAKLPNEAMRPLLRAQGPHVDRMMAAVASEYMDELERLSVLLNGCSACLPPTRPPTLPDSTTNSTLGTSAWSSPAPDPTSSPEPFQPASSANCWWFRRAMTAPGPGWVAGPARWWTMSSAISAPACWAT
jgi:hypothetical protein